MPGKSATDVGTFVGGGFDSAQEYPLEISAYLNGAWFDSTVYVHIGTA
jgi:hypothetical protein